MRKKRWALTEEAVFEGFLLLVACQFLVVALGYSATAKLFPLLVAVPLVLGLAVQTVRAARVPVDASRDQAAARMEFALTTAWMAGLILIIWVIGLVPAMFVIPVLYMRVYCQEPWKITLAVSVFLVVFTYVFMSGLGIPMYTGVVLEALERAY
jgi:hypothetical protein